MNEVLKYKVSNIYWHDFSEKPEKVEKIFPIKVNLNVVTTESDLDDVIFNHIKNLYGKEPYDVQWKLVD